MNRNSTRVFVLIGSLPLIVAAVYQLIVVVAPDSDLTKSLLTPPVELAVICGALLGMVLLLVGWWGALVKTARLKRYGWCFFLLVFEVVILPVLLVSTRLPPLLLSVPLLIYSFVGPTTDPVHQQQTLPRAAPRLATSAHRPKVDWRFLDTPKIKTARRLAATLLVVALVSGACSLVNLSSANTQQTQLSESDVVEAESAATATAFAGQSLQPMCGIQVMSPGDICYECAVSSGGFGPPTPIPVLPQQNVNPPCYPDQPVGSYTYDQAVKTQQQDQQTAEDSALADIQYTKSQLAAQRQSKDVSMILVPMTGIAAIVLFIIGVLLIVYARRLRAKVLREQQEAMTVPDQSTVNQ